MSHLDHSEYAISLFCFYSILKVKAAPQTDEQRNLNEVSLCCNSNRIHYS